MGNVKTIRNGLIDCLEEDTQLAKFCDDTFDKDPTILNAFDANNPPGAEASPYIAVLTGKRHRDRGFHYYQHALIVMVAVHDETCTTTGSVITYSGCDVRDDLAALVERITTLYLSGLGVASTQVPDVEDQTAFPWFSAFWTYHVMVRDIL